MTRTTAVLAMSVGAVLLVVVGLAVRQVTRVSAPEFNQTKPTTAPPSAAPESPPKPAADAEPQVATPASSTPPAVPTSSGRPVAIAAPAVPSSKINVGYLLSKTTADDRSNNPKGWGYGSQTRMMKELGLDHPRFNRIPIVEPGTANDAEIKATCEKYFNGQTPIEFTDAAAMKRIDVYVACCLWCAQPKLIDFLHHMVVDEGKGLLVRTGLGIYNIGLGEADDIKDRKLLDLNGLRSGRYRYSGDKTPVGLVDPQGLFGEPFASPDRPVWLETNGIFGENLGSSLMQTAVLLPVTPESKDGQPAAPAQTESLNLSMVTLAEVGRGKVVSLNYYGLKKSDPPTVEFVKIAPQRAIRWLAGETP